MRIVNVASAAHMFGRIDFDDLMRDRAYQPWDAYGGFAGMGGLAGPRVPQWAIEGKVS